MSKKKILLVITGLLIIASLAFVVFIGCTVARISNNETNITLKTAVLFPSSGSFVYYFVLRSDRTLSVSTGFVRTPLTTASNFNTGRNTEPFLVQIHDATEIIIDDEQYYHLVNIANRLPVGGFESDWIVSPFSRISIFYNGSFYTSPYRMTFPEYAEEIMRELIHEMIELSPLPVDPAARRGGGGS